VNDPKTADNLWTHFEVKRSGTQAKTVYHETVKRGDDWYLRTTVYGADGRPEVVQYVRADLVRG
jgi:hypothetical protein